MPQGVNHVISEYHDFRACIFGHWKGLGRFEAIASLDAYQITKYQILLLDFWRIQEKEFLNQEFYGQLLEQAWSKGSFDFSKIVPLGVPRSLIQMISKRKGVFIGMHLLPTVITNSFKIQNQTFEKHFHFCVLILWSWNLSLFRNISKIHNEKGTSSFISCACWH